MAAASLYAASSAKGHLASSSDRTPPGSSAGLWLPVRASKLCASVSHRPWKLQIRHGHVSAAIATPELVQKEVNYDALAEQLSKSSPLQIIDRALTMFGSDTAIAFSGAEDVALIEYAKLTGKPFRVFSLDTGRLNPETYKFFAEVEKHYGIRIEYMFPDAIEVEALVRSKGLFSFYEDGHQECCQIRKVKPLKRALKGLKAWITGQRKDQSPGTRSKIPIVQIDPSFEGMDGGVGSLVKWNPLANIQGIDVWNFLRTMEVPVNTLHSQGFISIGCEPCTRPVLPGQHEREGRWWWEDAKAKECGLHKGNIDITQGHTSMRDESSVPADLFLNERIHSFSREEIENLAKSETRDNSWIIVLYAPWCPFCQAMQESYNALADELADSTVSVGKFNADGANKPFAQTELQLRSYPTILFLSKNVVKPIKYPSEQRDVPSLLKFIEALQ